MSSVTFDTLKFVERLEAGGFTHAQAKAAADAFSDALGEAVVTHSILQSELHPIKTDMAVLKWMVGFTLAGVTAALMIMLRH